MTKLTIDLAADGALIGEFIYANRQRGHVKIPLSVAGLLVIKQILMREAAGEHVRLTREPINPQRLVDEWLAAGNRPNQSMVPEEFRDLLNAIEI